MSDSNTVDTLNTLIETCKDGEYGFRTSAEHVKSADLKSIFLSRSQDCQRGASELQAIVARLGGKAETDSSVTGTMHRGWVSVVGTLTGYSDQQMLDECERGEDAARLSVRDRGVEGETHRAPGLHRQHREARAESDVTERGSGGGVRAQVFEPITLTPHRDELRGEHVRKGCAFGLAAHEGFGLSSPRLAAALNAAIRGPQKPWRRRLLRRMAGMHQGASGW